MASVIMGALSSEAVFITTLRLHVHSFRIMKCYEALLPVTHLKVSLILSSLVFTSSVKFRIFRGAQIGNNKIKQA